MNFIEAYKTKQIPDNLLQSLLPDDWSRQCVINFNSEESIVSFAAELPTALQYKYNGLSSYKRIEKVENPYLWLMYQLKLCESQIQPDSDQIEHLAHGTYSGNVPSIIRNNFNYRLAGRNVGVRLGKGVYFAYDSNFAIHYGNCFVLTEVLKGSVLCSSSCSNNNGLPPPGHSIGDLQRIAKFYDHEFYPKYLIHRW